MDSNLDNNTCTLVSYFCDRTIAYIQSIHAIVCLKCQYIIPRDTITRHLTDHKNHHLSRPLIAQICTELDSRYSQIITSTDSLFQKPYSPPLSNGPLPYLPILTGYYRCDFENPDTRDINNNSNKGTCTFVASSCEAIKGHSRNVHGWRARHGRPRGDQSATVPWISGITCQRLRKTSPGKAPFQVRVETARLSASKECTKDNNQTTQIVSTMQHISHQLATEEAKLIVLQSSFLSNGGLKLSATYNRSPWLELTQWPIYFSGVNLADTVRLIELPSSKNSWIDDTGERVDEEALSSIIDTFDELVEEARETLTTGKMNVFDQCRISSFQRGQPYRRPIFTKLLDGTYKRYKIVWKQLLCYTIRVVYFRQEPLLHYYVTEPQTVAIDRLIAAYRAIQKLERQSRRRNSASQPSWAIDYATNSVEAQTHLRRCCLDLCISLLDHELRGNLYDSLIVSFLAVRGINKKTGCFQEPANYTSGLSAFIKLAQFLVAQRSVIGAIEGEVDFPSELLDKMQDRFMVFGSRSPIEWALKLRRYGRSVRDTTTAHGIITWSDDGDTISLKNISVNLPSLRWFLRDQVSAAQDLLEGLLLIPPGYDGDRAEMVPQVDVRGLKEDASTSTPGWSFLDHPENTQLQGKDKWLLDRVCSEATLKKRFMKPETGGPPQWRLPAVKVYLTHVADFLSHLLLLIHITSGQPARGTELLTVQWRNSWEGLRRTIYLENGLVSIITSSMKGYSVEESTRIIHRYLPPEVGELLIYYLWLVVPFCRQLQLIASPGNMGFTNVWLPPVESSLLWGSSLSKPWPTDRLSDILVQQFSLGLACPMNVSTWRHIAIAISRKCLSEKGFKRDYDDHIQQKADHQAGHSSLIAGNIYGRLINAAPGHVQSAQIAYRDISRKWHKCLGFGVFLPSKAECTKFNKDEKLPLYNIHQNKRKIDSEIYIDKISRIKC
jgi:hypothetical protein